MMWEQARRHRGAGDCKPPGPRHQLGLRAAIVLGALLASPQAPVTLASTSASPPRLHLHPCRLVSPMHLSSVAAHCGRLSVAENPAAPRGRRIELFVARVPAISLRKRPDPLFVLAGGPGQAAASFYAQAAPAFAWIHRDHDIILVDQRGTGRSNGLYCPTSKRKPSAVLSTQTLVRQTRACLRALSKHADVAFYTTTLAVGDLDRVRAALGYRRIDLYGESYGTLVAEEYLRRFGQHVRAVILDGVVPPQIALGARTPLNAQAALDRIFSRCARDAACHARFGDPASAYRQLRAALAKHPVVVSLANPTTGEPMQMTLTRARLDTVVRLSSYTSEQAALLPLLLDEAHARHDYRPLAAQYLIVSHTYAQAIAEGMQNTVVCTEDEPLYAQARLDPERLKHTFLGMRQINALEHVCAIWPHGPLAPHFHAPLHSNVPALLLSGTDDPVTPPGYAREAARAFTHHRLVELRGQGHGQLTAPCVGRLMGQFIDRGSTRGLNIACTRRARAFPFFTSFAGPAP